HQGNPHTISHCNPPFISLVYVGICKCIDKGNDADCGWLSFIEASLQDPIGVLQRRQGMEIAVLGGGHGCYAAAADLSEQGHTIRLWRRDASALKPVLATSTIYLKDDHGERPVIIDTATTDIGEAVNGAQLILIPSPAIAQQDIARALAPHLKDGQVVYLPPGTFGSYIMAETVRQLGSTADVAWAETGTLPWLARKHGPNTVAITMRATRLPTGVYPARRA